MKIILIGFVVLMIAGCGLPMPLSYLSYGWTAYDTHQSIHGDETVTDAALSMATNMDCKIVNALEDKKVCTKKAEVK